MTTIWADHEHRLGRKGRKGRNGRNGRNLTPIFGYG